MLCYKFEFIEQHLIGLANNLAEFKIKIYNKKSVVLYFSMSMYWGSMRIFFYVMIHCHYNIKTNLKSIIIILKK